MTDIAIYLGVGLLAVAFFFGLRFVAGKIGAASLETAKADLATLPGFNPGETLIYLGSAISYDPVRNQVAIWEKSGGARLVDPSGLGAWRSGVTTTVLATRAVTTPMIELYAKPDDKRPFFKVGVLNQMDCPRWRDRLQAAFGAEKERT